MISFFICFSIFSGVVLLGQLTLKTSYTKNNQLLENLTVIIPFRNEQKGLKKLLENIQNQDLLPAKFIFINDHSEDISVEVIEQFKHLPLEIIHLSAAETGKKAALKKAIQQIKTAYILTIDGDVCLPENYFRNLSTLTLKDIHLLPVKFEGNEFMHFFHLDYYYLFALSNGFHFSKKVIASSGANLLVKTVLYQNYLSSAEYQEHISSGDDYFLIHYLQKEKIEITQTTEREFCVKTSLPNSFNEIIQQRARWISKSKPQNNLLELILGLIGMIYHFGFILVCIFYSEFIVESILLKIVLDTILFYPYLVRINQKISILHLSVFALFYPFWMVFILIYSRTQQSIWKGRNINA